METIFNFSNMIVMPFWILMIGLPTWRWTKRIIGSPLIALPVAAIYLYLMISNAQAFAGEGLDLSLAGIARGLGTLEGATVGWAHFLAFDLLVGRSIYLDSREKKLSPWLVGVALFFTLMMGPIGYLLYLLIGGWRRAK